MGRSLKSAKGVLECLRTHALGFVLGGVADRRTSGRRMPTCSSRMSVTWLKTDEHALAGGLASKLSEAEGRAIKLLTPPKPLTRCRPSRPLPPVPGKKWSQVGTGRKDRLTSKDWRDDRRGTAPEAGGEPRYRLTIQWTLEEGPQ